MMRTANPALNAKTFSETGYSDSAMTLEGTAYKSLALLVILMISATVTWGQPANLGLLVLGGAGSFIAALVTIFKKTASPVSAPIYAICEGLLLGSLSRQFEMQYPGIVGQAVFLTFSVFGALLLAYITRIIKPTENFKLGIFAATGGIALFYLGSMIMGFFGVSSPLMNSQNGSLVSIVFSGFVVLIAALNLVLDFDFIESGVERQAPKYMEWYSAFGLLVTLVWLYVEILRLLSKLQSRR